MKLKLSIEKGVVVLDVLEDVTSPSLEALQAGLTKLLKSGKNKIIINLLAATELNVTLLGDIIRFNRLAAELRGQIMLVGHGDLALQAAREAAGAAGGLKHFSTREAALAAMHELSAASDVAADFTLDGDPNGRLKQKAAELRAENAGLKASVAKLKGQDELRRLRLERGQLEARLAACTELLTELRRERKPPYVLAATSAKMQALESAMRVFLKQEGLLAKAGSSGGA